MQTEDVNVTLRRLVAADLATQRIQLLVGSRGASVGHQPPNFRRLNLLVGSADVPRRWTKSEVWLAGAHVRDVGGAECTGGADDADHRQQAEVLEPSPRRQHLQLVR